ncbi:MAG: bifunctional riboflavin kinase/FAD synthetase [Bacteroidetes bacterium]|nr:bifunctional riboflavin kinase/FAD synthetase [Bacteroidota bacterium]
MKIYNCIKDFKPVVNAIVTIGTFDGVHLGHQAVFKQMRDEAEKIGGETVVITFYPHPRIVLGVDNTDLKFIKTEKKKIQHIEKAGIDNLIIIEFTEDFAATSSEDFIKDLIVDYIKPKVLIIGYDHQFGSNREGSFELLNNLGNNLGFEVKKVDEQNVEDITISSTQIRNLLNQGDIKSANRLLGHEYSITGIVVKGQSIGHNLGFPTANIEIADEYKLIAAIGVYACRVHIGQTIYKGMSNIGYRPTIDKIDNSDPGITIEVNIFDFNESIYGKEITISFVDWMRNEHKFESKEALSKQLAKDKIHALEIL